MSMRLLLSSAVLLLANANADELQQPVELAHLRETGRWDSTPAGFRIIALSHLADGCAWQGRAVPGRRDAARRCVNELERLARRTGPATPEAAVDGLWLTHFNLVLGAEDALGGCSDPALHERVSRRLSAMSLADPHAHAPSYAKLKLRWPADQSATLASLSRFDEAHGQHLAVEPLRRWKAQLAKSMDEARRLPRSELTGGGTHSEVARGCAQSLMTRYLAEFDPPLARALFVPYREQYLAQRGPLVGFREWPEGVNGPADVDSGPIVDGVGAAASALAIGAARAVGEDVLAAQLQASADLVLAAGLGGKAAQGLLPTSIRFVGRWQPEFR